MDRVIQSLKAIERNMKPGYQLFAHADALYLVKLENDEILETFDISCDGGDPNVREREGREYLDR